MIDDILTFFKLNRKIFHCDLWIGERMKWGMAENFDW